MKCRASFAQGQGNPAGLIFPPPMRLRWIGTLKRMAKAHVCMECGTDLARVRVQREPHYQLPLVVCPRCRAVSIRRCHPIIARYRHARLVALAVAAVIIQLGLIGLFTFLNMMAAVTLMFSVLEVSEHRSKEEIMMMGITALVVVPIATGAWLSVSFYHLRRWRVWLGWFAFMLVPPGVLGWALAMSGEFTMGESLWLGHDADSFAAVVAMSTVLFIIVASGPLLVMMIVATAGIPLGLGVVWIHRWFQRALWRTRLRRARHWRIA